MTKLDLIALRRKLDLTQTQMAERMGLSMRALQDVEHRDKEPSTRHVLLAERVALTIAVERADPMLAPANVRDEALTIAQMIRGR